MTTFHDFNVKTIDGTSKSLADYRGKVCLVVNVASECGYTFHYEGLEKLYRELKDKDFVVLGFPCNDFGGQEPGTEADIAAFCASKYDVTFPMFGKVSILTAPRAPLYEFLTKTQSAPEGPGDVAWNFAKFLIGKDGKVVARFAHRTKPEAPELRTAIESALSV
ncbi:MAG: glutathione peroxidase [Sandaracinaceae bacterium]|jgi:glutathione peroxidase|nr:glutathione peroxidase [Sandaracinaceae bacterium]